MKAVNVLVIEHDEKILQGIDEVLTIHGYRYDVATSLAEAIRLLDANTYTCVLLGDEVPARLGNVPRRQNAENFMDKFTSVGITGRPPVILLFNPMPDVEEEDKLRWAADMRSRGVATFVRKPFRTAGRTLDRVIKKLLAGQVDHIRLGTIPLVPITRPGAPLPAAPAPDAEGLSTKTPRSKLPALDELASADDAIELDEFMAKYCEPRSRENRMYRKRALLAAARHGTVTLPALVGPHKHGQPKRYRAPDLLGAWPGFIDKGVDLPPLRPLPDEKNTAA